MVCIDYMRFEIDFRQTNVAQKHVDMQILSPLSSFPNWLCFLKSQRL